MRRCALNQVKHLPKQMATLQTDVESLRTELRGKIEAADNVLANRISSSEGRL